MTALPCQQSAAQNSLVEFRLCACRYSRMYDFGYRTERPSLKYRGPSPRSRALASHDRLTRSSFAAGGGGRSSSSSDGVARSFMTVLHWGQPVTVIPERAGVFWIRESCSLFLVSKIPCACSRAA